VATPRTRRLVGTGDASAKLAGAQRSRARLREEAIKLHQAVALAQKRLEEIDEEEQVHSDAIEHYAGMIAEAHKEPTNGTTESEEAEGARSGDQHTEATGASGQAPDADPDADPEAIG